MFPSYDMNPIARNAMQRDRLAADIAAVDNRQPMRARTTAFRPVPAASIVLALLIVAAVLI